MGTICSSVIDEVLKINIENLKLVINLDGKSMLNIMFASQYSILGLISHVI